MRSTSINMNSSSSRCPGRPDDLRSDQPRILLALMMSRIQLYVYVRMEFFSEGITIYLRGAPIIIGSLGRLRKHDHNSTRVDEESKNN